MKWDARDNDRFRVVDRDTGQIISHVLCCDDVTGWYERYVINGYSVNGPVFVISPETGRPKTERKRARLMVFRIEE